MVPQSNPQTGASGEDDIFAEIMDLDGSGGEVNIGLDDDDIMADVDDSLTPNAPKASDNKGGETDWEQRYKDSSREAVRLDSELKKVMPYQPVLEMLSKDDKFKDYIMQYGKETKTETLPEKLNLPEEFDFDMNEALRDPTSESGQILAQVSQHYAQPIVNKGLEDDAKKRADNIRKDELSRQRELLQTKYGVDGEQFDSLIDWAGSHTMTYEDMFFLRKKDDHARRVSNDTKLGIAGQVNRMKGVPMGAVTGETDEVKTEDKMMDTIINFDKGQSLFND